MVELNYKQINGLLLLVILLSSGGTSVVLEKTIDYINCRGDWILQDSGQYKCSKDDSLQWCYEIEARGSGWNRCHIGKIVVQEIEKLRLVDINGLDILDEFTTSPDDKICYPKGNLRRGILCENI